MSGDSYVDTRRYSHRQFQEFSRERKNDEALSGRACAVAVVIAGVGRMRRWWHERPADIEVDSVRSDRWRRRLRRIGNVLLAGCPVRRVTSGCLALEGAG